MLHTSQRQPPTTIAPTSTAKLDDLIAAMDPVVPIFVLIDPMLGEPVPAEESREGWARPLTPVTLHHRVTLEPHQQPYLVALAGISDLLLGTTLTIAHNERSARLDAGLGGHGGAAHRICGWLQSSMHADDLAVQLSAMFQVRTDAYTTATYLRLLDRRVLGLLRHVIGNARVAAQFGRLQSWTYIGPLGELATVRSTAQEATPIRLSKSEWDNLEEGEAIHRTIRQWLGELALTGRAAPHNDLSMYDQARQALREAAQLALRWPHRFKQLQDETTWAVMTLLYPGLAQIASVAALMQDVGTADAPAEQLMYTYPEIHTLALHYLASKPKPVSQ